jgi:hypothetical protein
LIDSFFGLIPAWELGRENTGTIILLQLVASCEVAADPTLHWNTITI